MSKYVNRVVPFQIWGNKQVLGDKQLAESEWLCEFVEKFRHCFEYDPTIPGLVYNPPEEEDHEPLRADTRTD